MSKFMNFAANVQTVFNNDANDFMAFSQLLTDVALGRQEVSKEEANAKIVGIITLDGYTVESISMHLIDRIIGSESQKRRGVSIDSVV